MVATLYKEYVKMPETDAEWESELIGFLENYEFPTVGAWDGFHIYIRTYAVIVVFLVQKALHHVKFDLGRILQKVPALHSRSTWKYSWF